MPTSRPGEEAAPQTLPSGTTSTSAAPESASENSASGTLAAVLTDAQNCLQAPAGRKRLHSYTNVALQAGGQDIKLQSVLKRNLYSQEVGQKRRKTTVATEKIDDDGARATEVIVDGARATEEINLEEEACVGATTPAATFPNTGSASADGRGDSNNATMSPVGPPEVLTHTVNCATTCAQGPLLGGPSETNMPGPSEPDAGHAFLHATHIDCETQPILRAPLPPPQSRTHPGEVVDLLTCGMSGSATATPGVSSSGDGGDSVQCDFCARLHLYCAQHSDTCVQSQLQLGCHAWRSWMLVAVALLRVYAKRLPQSASCARRPYRWHGRAEHV